MLCNNEEEIHGRDTTNKDSGPKALTRPIHGRVLCHSSMSVVPIHSVHELVDSDPGIHACLRQFEAVCYVTY